jgi:hypothetical protein
MGGASRPAFPARRIEGVEVSNSDTVQHIEVMHPGITAREYFAARAPREIPGWFMPELPPRPVPPSTALNFELDEGANDNVVARQLAQQAADTWRRDPCYELSAVRGQSYPNAFAAYEATWTAHHDSLVAWELQREQQRIAQWPWTWADLVLGAQERLW